MNIAIALSATLALGLFYSWTSRMNGIFFFGRSVSPELSHSQEALAITRRYRVAMVAAMLVSAAVSCLATLWVPRLIAAGPLLLPISFGFLFARANREARTLQATEPLPSRTVVQVNLDPACLYWIPGWPTALLPVALAMLVFIGSVLLAGKGLGFQAGWTLLMQRTDAGSLSGLLGMSLGLLSAASLLLGLLKTSVRLRTRMAQYSVRASLVVQWIGASLFSAVLAIAAKGLVLPHGLGKGIMVSGVVLAMAVMVGNQKRSAQFIPPAAELGLDDRWRWGLFYLDKQDPALFVQSRCGTGYTLNYGRMAAWPIAVALAAYFVSMLFLAPHHR